MADTVLKICQVVSRRVGIPVPLILVSSGDEQVQQMRGLLDEVGQDLISRFRWQELTRRTTFVTTATESQGLLATLLGAEPEAIANATFFDDALRQPLYGPLDDKEYQVQKSYIPSGPTYQYRIQNNELLMLPVPIAGHTISVIYRLKTWLVNGSILKQEIDADDDQPLLDDKLITLGLQARWKEEKGLPYAENARRFESMAISKAAKSGTKPVLHMDDGMEETFPAVIVPTGSTIPY